MENNIATDDTQGLYNRAMHAYAAWQAAEDQRDEDAWESQVYAHGLASGLSPDPTLLTTPAPVGACDAARQAYTRAYDAYYDARNQAPGDDLPDPAREPAQPLAWLPQKTTSNVAITEMTDRAIYVNYPSLDPPPAEFTAAEFLAWDEECRILLVNGDDDAEVGPISIDECLAGGAIKAVTVKIGGTDQRLYTVQPGHYSPQVGFLHPGRR